jgi:uncharacterized membrane protein required for colicin V production
MSLLDIALVIVWLGLALCGFWKGAVRIVFGIGGVIVGVAVAVAFGADLALTLAELLGPGVLAEVLARVVPAVGCMVVLALSGWGLEKTLKAMHLNWFNRLIGAVLTGVVGAAVLVLLLGIAARSSPAWAELCSDSVLLPWVQGLLDRARGLA